MTERWNSLEAREGPGPPPKLAATSVNIIEFRGNLVEDTNKSPIRPPKINVQVPPLLVSSRKLLVSTFGVV